MGNEKGRTVLITGTSTGIGYTTAALLAKNGWTVFAGVRRQSDFEKLQSVHSNIRPLFLDVTLPDQIAAAAEAVRVAVGEAGLDALVNNAGVATAYPFECVPPEEFEQQFQINLFGSYRLTQALLPLLRLGRQGRIINVSSGVGKGVLPYGCSYVAAKHALEGLTTTMRLELAHTGNSKSSAECMRDCAVGISVSILGPGPVLTSFGDHFKKRLEATKHANKQGIVFDKFYAERMEGSMRLVVPSAAPSTGK